MAEYWIEYPDKKLSEKIDSLTTISQLIENIIESADKYLIHAEGENIIMPDLVMLSAKRKLPISIENTSFTEIEINSTMNSQLTFFNCIIDDLVVRNYKNKINIDLVFNKCTVTKCAIERCNNVENFILKNSCVFSEINLSDNTTIKNIEISNSTINNTIRTNGLFVGSETVISSFKISDSSILKSSRINYCIIDNLHIDNSGIKEFAFSESTFLDEIHIGNTEKGFAYYSFSNCIIESNKIMFFHIAVFYIEFTKTQFKKKLEIDSFVCKESVLILDKCQFANEVNFSDSLYIDTCMNLIISETVFKELVLFDEKQPQKLIISNSLFQNGILIPFTKVQFGESQMRIGEIVINNPEKIHSSVWCVLKNQALQRNDKIIALNYRKNEMNSFKNELKSTKGNIEEKIVLWLNNISNSHGLSWVKGLKFTFCVWTIFFTLYAWASYDFTHNYKFGDIIFNYKIFYANAFKFLWLPQGIEDFAKTLTKSLKWYSTVFLVFSFIMGKIAIAYGIYQTISAFRKHGKI